MPDPEQILRNLPEESPPPEIVLAAVRVFRYRAVAVVAVASLLVAAGLLWHRWDVSRSRVDVQMAQAGYEGGAEILARTQVVDGVHVTLWDVAFGDDRRFARFFAVDPGGRSFGLGLPRIIVDGRPVALDQVELIGGGGCCAPSASDLVISFPAPDIRSGDVAISIDLDVIGAGETVLGTAHFEFGPNGGSQ